MEASAVVPASMQQQYMRIHVEDITPSKTNPASRTKGPEFDELVASVRSKGVLMPILVRPDGELYQVVAGHRRLAAARVAGLYDIPAVVREMTESEALELQLVENLQRADLHPLEEAEGYRRLMQLAKLDAAGVSEHIGRSVAYVYDRIKLLELVPAAREHFLAGRILAGHAIILARLKPDEQLRAIKGGLFTHQELLFDPLEEPFKLGKNEDDSKPVSARELQAWVDDHIRFDPKNVDPMLFPDTALALEAAVKVVPITFSYMLRAEARDEKVRTYGEQAWKRADGQQKSKTCDRSVTGVVVAGARRGESFSVCVDKGKCSVHWADEVRARKSRAATAEKAPPGGGATPRQQPKTDEKLEQALREGRTKAHEAIEGAVSAAVSRMSGERFVRVLLASLGAHDWTIREFAKKRKITVPQQAKAFTVWAGKVAISTVNELVAYVEMENGAPDDFAEAVGVDVKAIYRDHELRARAELKGEKAAEPLKPKKTAKKAASKKRSR